MEKDSSIRARNRGRFEAMESVTERYKFISKIGRGAYAVVYKAWDEVEHKTVAVKLIELGDGDDDIDYVHQEIAVMSKLNRPQLIKYFASYVMGASLWIVMEYLEAGSLADMVKEIGPLDETMIAYVMKELVLVRDSNCVDRLASRV